MKQLVFRTFGILLGCAALFIAFFEPVHLSNSGWLIARNIFFGSLLLAYGVFGAGLISKIPILKMFVDDTKETNKQNT
jgi:hypothetical protein